MNWINVVVVLVLSSLAILFALSNTDPVRVGFANLSTPDVPLFVPVFSAFLIGFAGGVLSLSFSRRKHKREISRLRHENRLLQQEVENLRNIPLQDEL